MRIYNTSWLLVVVVHVADVDVCRWCSKWCSIGKCTFCNALLSFSYLFLPSHCTKSALTKGIQRQRERERVNMCGRLVHTYIPRYSMCFYMSERQRGSKLNFVCDLLFGFEVYFPFITAIKWVCVWVCGSWKEKEYDDVVVVMATRVWQCAYAVLNVHKLVFLLFCNDEMQQRMHFNTELYFYRFFS